MEKLIYRGIVLWHAVGGRHAPCWQLLVTFLSRQTEQQVSRDVNIIPKEEVSDLVCGGSFKTWWQEQEETGRKKGAPFLTYNSHTAKLAASYMHINMCVNFLWTSCVCGHGTVCMCMCGKHGCVLVSCVLEAVFPLRNINWTVGMSRRRRMSMALLVRGEALVLMPVWATLSNYCVPGHAFINKLKTQANQTLLLVFFF